MAFVGVKKIGRQLLEFCADGTVKKISEVSLVSAVQPAEEQASEPDPEPVAEVEEAPKPKRRGRPKKNAEPES